MSFYASAASQENLNPGPREPHLAGHFLGLRPVARPLVPVTLALMAGIAAPAWGLRLPEPWLLAGAVALWAVLALLWWRRRPARFLPLILFMLLGVAFHQQAGQPDFPHAHLTKLPQNQSLTLFGHLNRPGKLGAGSEQRGMKEAKEEDKDDWVQFGRLESEEKYRDLVEKSLVGVYLIQIIFILTGTLVTIDSGEDRLERTSKIGMNLKKGMMFYFFTALIASLALFVLTTIVLGNLV